MVSAAILFAVAARARESHDAQVMGVSIERGAPEALSGVVSDEPWSEAVVRIETRRCSGDHSVATGVLIDGLVLTNRHVIAGAAQVTVETLAGQRFDAVSMRQSPTIDLGAAVVPELDGGLALATDQRVEAGTTLTAVGFPGGGQLNVSTVAVSKRAVGLSYPDSAEPLQLDTEVVQGQSGSPLIDAEGRVAGLIYSRSFAGGWGLAHDADELDAQWSTLTSSGFDSCA